MVRACLHRYSVPTYSWCHLRALIPTSDSQIYNSWIYIPLLVHHNCNQCSTREVSEMLTKNPEKLELPPYLAPFAKAIRQIHDQICSISSFWTGNI